MSIESDKLLKEKYIDYFVGKIELDEFLSEFNITIDKSKLDYYRIKKFDVNEGKIELLCENHLGGIQYSRYSSGKHHVTIFTNPYKIDRHFNGTDLESEKLTYYVGDYSLEFLRSNPSDVLFHINGGFSISCFEDYHRLFKRRYADIEADGIKTGFFELTEADSKPILIKKYTYYNNDNIVHSILNAGDGNSTVRGICLEKRDVNLSDFWENGYQMISDKRYPKLNDDNVSSAVVFRGFSNIGEYHGESILEIYKIDSSAFVKYRFFNPHKKISQEYTVPLLNDGNITSDELRILSQNLLLNHENDEFIGISTVELMNFAKAIDIRKNGYCFDFNDILNPVLYKDMSLEQIASIVEQDERNFYNSCSNYFSNNNYKPVVLEKVDNNQ